MMIAVASSAPADISGVVADAPRHPPGAQRRKHVIVAIALATLAHQAVDKRTVVGAIVVVIGVVAAARLAAEGGNPLEWYLGRGSDENGRST